MAGILALFACLVGWFLFYLGRKQTQNSFPWELYIPMTWFMVAASRPVSAWFMGSIDSMTFSVEEGNPINRNFLLVLITLAICALAKRGVNVSLIVRQNGLFFFFLAYCLISILWSDFPFVSIKRLIKEVGNVLMLVVLLSNRQGFGALRTMVCRTSYIFLPLSIYLIKYKPSLGRLYHPFSGEMASIGVALNKNGLGAFCMIAGIFLLREIKGQNGRVNLRDYNTLANLCFMGVAIWFLLGVDSATALICFLGGLAYTGSQAGGHGG